jgi:hypothetical protein
MPSFVNAVSNFVIAITGIFTSLLSSVLAVFQSILALAQNLVNVVLQLVQSVIALVLELTQGVVGFAVGESKVTGRVIGCDATDCSRQPTLLLCCSWVEDTTFGRAGAQMARAQADGSRRGHDWPSIIYVKPRCTSMRCPHCGEYQYNRTCVLIRLLPYVSHWFLILVELMFREDSLTISGEEAQFRVIRSIKVVANLVVHLIHKRTDTQATYP